MGKVISTNIGERKTIIHNGKEIETGIYKHAVEESIFLGITDVINDQVVDRRYHGGVDKACYLYPSENYEFWKTHFPALKWEWGMFGENLTIEGLIEAETKIGACYQIGEAVVQVTQPRQPCFKLGIRFENHKMVKLFSDSPFPGIYVRIIKEGFVKSGDSIKLIEDHPDGLSLVDVFSLLMKRNENEVMNQKALNDPYLAQSAKKDIQKIINSKKK